jgi:hypothetical protein
LLSEAKTLLLIGRGDAARRQIYRGHPEAWFSGRLSRRGFRANQFVNTEAGSFWTGSASKPCSRVPETGDQV